MKNLYNKILTVGFIIGMILNMYGDMVFSVYTIFTIVMFAICIFSHKHRPFIAFPCEFFYMIILFIIIRGLRMSSEHFPLGVLMMMIFFGVYYAGLEKELFIRCYQKVGFILCCVLIIQFVQLQLFGVSFSGIFTFLPINVGGNVSGFDSAAYITSIAEEQRCNSLFAEPSHFAQFIMPLIAIDLFLAKDNYHLKRSVFWIVCTLLSKSGMGVIGLAVIGFAYLINYLKTRNISHVVLQTIIWAIPVSIILVYLFQSVLFVELMSRTDEFSGDNENISGYVRVVRGFVVYDHMSLAQKITGISGRELDAVINSSGLFASFSKDAGIYFNFIQNMLIGDGLIVFIMFVFFVIKLYKLSDYAGKTILSVFVVFAAMESMYFTPVFQIYIISILLLIGKDKIKTKILY